MTILLCFRMEESSKPLILVYWTTPWGGGGGGDEDWRAFRAYKNFILRMVSYYGGLDTLREIKLWVFNFISLGS